MVRTDLGSRPSGRSSVARRCAQDSRTCRGSSREPAAPAAYTNNVMTPQAAAAILVRQGLRVGKGIQGDVTAPCHPAHTAAATADVSAQPCRDRGPLPIAVALRCLVVVPNGLDSDSVFLSCDRTGGRGEWRAMLTQARSSEHRRSVAARPGIGQPVLQRPSGADDTALEEQADCHLRQPARNRAHSMRQQVPAIAPQADNHGGYADHIAPLILFLTSSLGLGDRLRQLAHAC